ncbi:MAG TPA: sigma 54-interacting transcriptional regulator [Burkholderiaceae bacterium]|nr:sigma 54-interacting transcriptional regulator [Burkholderiaceae bacterium]
MEADSGSGQLVLDAAARVVWSGGAATHPLVQKALRERLPQLGRQPCGAFLIESPRPLLVTHRAVGQTTVFYIQADPASDATAAAPWIHAGSSGELAEVRRGDSGLEDIVGSSEAIQQLKYDILKIAPLEVGVLIVGESGTGKELAALAIHALSQRRANRMIFVNAAALPSSLVESELFGYEPGAFTGAERAGRKGKFELAHRSSLFFDEVGDMPSEIQVKLLRVLQDGMFERVGGHKPQHSDFRLICASNRNFQQMIGDGDFRLDLYYRISGVTLRMPSLRERLEDIPELVTSFLAAFAGRHRAQPKTVDPEVYGLLREQSWPGNVRQLLHEVERAAIFCEGPRLTVRDFRRLETGPAAAPQSPAAAPPLAAAPAVPVQGRGVRAARDELELAMIREALARHGGNKKKVAEELGISRTYLYKRLNSE